MDPEAVENLCSQGESDGHGTNRVQHGSTDDPQLLDFSANTNPRIPDGVAQVYEAAFGAARTYPADDYSAFRSTAAEYVGCEATQVVPTAGGISAIRLTVGTHVAPSADVLLPSPTFGEYAREVELQGGDPTFVAHDELLNEDPSRFSLVVACTPNNPTGDAYHLDRLRAFADECERVGTPLLVDEAFIGFTDCPSLAGHDGAIVVRSLTKLFGFPGLRAGFAVATGASRTRLDTARPAWGLSTPAAAVGEYCMQQTEFVAETRRRVTEERERMRERLADRFDVFPSDAPFLLLELREDSVEEVFAAARGSDIVIRDARTFRGLDNHVRVAVRLPEENDRLLEALDV